MKKDDFLFVLFVLAVIFLVILTSCGAPKKSIQENPPPTEPEKISLTAKLIDSFAVTSATLAEAQFFSGSDTIILERELVFTQSALGQKGKIVLSGGVPVERNLVSPNTPGIVTTITTDPKTKKIKLIEVDFGLGSLVFGPAADSVGTFVIYCNSKNQVAYAGATYTLTAGGGTGNPLQILPEWRELEGTQKIAPGKRVGQALPKGKKN